jgi:hypothetical protein
MKTKILWKWSVGASLVALPFLGCGQKSTATNPAPAVIQNQMVFAGEDLDNSPSGEESDQDLENAEARVVSQASIPSNNLSSAAAEIVKLAQAGVDESVMMTYVSNSANVFTLTSDDIVYLNDVGVPGTVITAMLQLDQALQGDSAMASAPPVYTNQPVPAPGAPTPYATPQGEEQQTATAGVEPSLQSSQVNVSYTYFYDSLAPYGTWIDIAGYGLCWQPTVVAVNRNWQPYSDRGRWVYTDLGWHWISDYSWGWAPFHYGRWFQHSRLGWCWAPDTVWGPAWVSWRYTSDYCGWAPLPPSAFYRPGFGFTYYGRSVGVGFGFGLSPRYYVFVPVRNFCDRHVYRHRLPGHRASQIYHRTRVVQRYDRDERNRVINRGIPVEHVRAVTRTSIRPIPTRETDRPGQARFERGERDNVTRLAVYRPEMPQPEGRGRLVGEGVRPASRREMIRGSSPRAGDNVSIIAPSSPAEGPPRLNPAGNRLSDRRGDNVPVVRNTNPRATQPSPQADVPAVGPGRQTRAITPRVESPSTPAVRQNDRRSEPPIIRRPNRSQTDRQNSATAPEQTVTSPDNRSLRESTRPSPPTIPPSVSTPQPSVPVTRPQPVPTRQFPTVRQIQPVPTPAPVAPVQNPPVRENQRVFRQGIPRASEPARNIAPTAPVQRQQSAPAYQPPRAIEQPRPSQSIAPRAPSRVETPAAPRMQNQQRPPQQAPAIQRPSPSQSQPSSRPQPSGRGDNEGGNRRNR